MGLFTKKKNFLITYWVFNPACVYKTVVKAKDIGKAVRLLEKKETLAVSIISWEVIE